MFIHDLIKIKYIQEGYLPNNPYHLISDGEMISAFKKEGGYFELNYPLIDAKFVAEYTQLKSSIFTSLDRYLEEGVEIPNWVYSYMLGAVMSINTSEPDIDYLFGLLNLESSGAFDADLADSCLKVSKEWVSKLTEPRPATIFGEPHVIKSLRLKYVDILA